MKKKKNLMEFMKRVIAGFVKEGRLGTAHVYQSTYNRILDFMGGRPMDFAELTPSWLKAFQNYLLSRQLQWNSISTYMRMLRAVYFRAVDQELAPAHPRLFHGVYTGTRVTVKRAVEAGVFRRLQEPLPKHTGLEKTRMLFLLLFMLRGIPFVDIAFLRRCDLEGDILTYRRRKTGALADSTYRAGSQEADPGIAEHRYGIPYIFPFIRYPGTDEYRQYQHALRKFNQHLKKLSGLLGQKIALSSYSARHSWATLANFCDYQQELISNAMGHSSVKVTETYFQRHSDDRIHAMNRGILSRVFADGRL